MGIVGLGLKSKNGFAIGDVVEVRQAEEILAGLDDQGERDSLQFMPEMLKFCGKQFVVDKISYKTCDTVNITGLHKMEDTVHLTGLRCDGQAHGGCQAGCLIYWKTDWLTRVPETGSASPAAPVPTAGSTTGSTPRTGCTSARLTEVALGACRLEDPMVVTDGPVYSCQATELPRAIGGVIPMWDVRQYVDDVRYGNAPLGRVLRGIVIEVFNKAQALSRLLLPRWLRIKGGLKYPYLVPSARQTPVTNLGLQAGDWVRVKSAEEIGKTLDKVYQNRGLYFDREMLNYCGRTAQVLRRVDQIVEETTGRMITMKTPCFILTDAVCKSDYHRSCPRGIYPYWREIWLERVPAPVHAGEMASTHAVE